MKKLTYQERVVEYRIETVEVEIPKKWGVATSQGEKTMTKNAKALISKILELKDKDDSISVIDCLIAFDKYFKSYQKFADTTREGANDTYVREHVLYLASEVLKTTNLPSEILDPLWVERFNYDQGKNNAK